MQTQQATLGPSSVRDLTQHIAKFPARNATLRVAQIIGDGRPGGGATFVLNLASALVTNGFDSAIVTQRDSYLLHKAQQAGFKAIGIDFASRVRSLASAFEIRRQLRDLDPALLHVHGARAGLPSVLSGEWTRVPMIYTVHGLHFHHKRGLRHAAGRASESMCFRCARETVFVSEGDWDCARREGILRHTRHHHVIRNAVPPLPTDFIAQATAASKLYDIVFFGRLEPQKNPLIIADILADLRPLQPSLCIVGTGSLEGNLRRRIDSLGLTGQVTWCGPLDHESTLRQVARARLMLLPSRWEGHPLSVIEAMQLGLPVVASDVCGTDEIVVDGETGYLVPVDDSRSYAGRIHGLLGDDRLRSRMGQAAAASIDERFSFDDHVRRHVALYRCWLSSVTGPTALGKARK